MSNTCLRSAILWVTLFCLCWRTSVVWCDEQPIELSPGGDIKKLTAQTESKVEETVQDLKSKDGDTLEASPSIQNSQQTDYNYVVSKTAQPLSLDLGQYSSVQTTIQDQSYQSQAQSLSQAPVVSYRYTTGGSDVVSSGEQQSPQQQQTYVRQEQPTIYEPKTYIRQALIDDSSDSSSAQNSGYRMPAIPELPRTQPGISTTYSSPNMKIVSHTRSFLPVVYNKPADESAEGSGQSNNAEQDYDKAVQDRPGGSYGQQEHEQQQQQPHRQQQSESYESDNQRDVDQEQSGRTQQSYDNSGPNDYRNTDILSRGPYYNIHKPHVAHLQIIEDSSDEKKDGFRDQPNYGYRTQPRPQLKNYRPSGYQPGMLNQYDPPSPPLSALLPPLTGQSDRDTDSDSGEDNDYDNREQSGRQPPQQLQQQPQNQQEYKQRPLGVEVEFDQAQKNDPNIIRGPGLQQQQPSQHFPSRQQNDYNGMNQQLADQSNNEGPDYNSQEQDRPLDSYENGNRGQDFIGNQLGPKYNVDGDEPEQGVYQQQQQQQQQQRGRPQQQKLVKPQNIEYGFIPLSEAKDIMGGQGYRGPENFRKGPNRPIQRPTEQGYGPEGYRDPRGFANGPRRPQFSGPPDGRGLVFGRGPAEGHRGGGYNGNDIYRDQQSGPMGGAPNQYRKPSFERPPPFAKNNGNEDNKYLTPFGGIPKDNDEEEEIDSDEGSYGKLIKKSNYLPETNQDSDEIGQNDPDKIPYECYPWNCNPWHSIHPNSPYNSVPLKGRGPHSGHSDLPPGASYNPRDVGLDEAVVAQLNLAASSPAGIAPGIVPPIAPPSHGFRPNLGLPKTPGAGLDNPFAAGSRPFINGYNNIAPGMPSQRPNSRPIAYSGNGEGYRSQYGYRAAASELSPVSAGANSPVLSNLLKLDPVKSFRSLVSYLTGGING